MKFNEYGKIMSDVVRGNRAYACQARPYWVGSAGRVSARLSGVSAARRLSMTTIGIQGTGRGAVDPTALKD